jgi:methylmalonyl-CoA mutase
MHYEMKKHTGELPIIGVNTYLNPNPPTQESMDTMELARATKEEKETQINNLRAFHQVNEKYVDEALQKLKKTAIENGNIFAELMNTVQVASLGQITQALYEVGGQYRRNM